MKKYKMLRIWGSLFIACTDPADLREIARMAERLFPKAFIRWSSDYCFAIDATGKLDTPGIEWPLLSWILESGWEPISSDTFRKVEGE